MDTASGNQEVPQAHHSPPVVNKYLFLGLIIAVLAGVILGFSMLMQSKQPNKQGQNTGISAPTPTIPLKEEYSNPFSSTSQYQNPFESTSGNNPFSALEQ